MSYASTDIRPILWDKLMAKDSASKDTENVPAYPSSCLSQYWKSLSSFSTSSLFEISTKLYFLPSTIHDHQYYLISTDNKAKESQLHFINVINRFQSLKILKCRCGFCLMTSSAFEACDTNIHSCCELQSAVALAIYASRSLPEEGNHLRYNRGSYQVLISVVACSYRSGVRTAQKVSVAHQMAIAFQEN